MKCYGHYKSEKNCKECEFLQSCQLFSATEGRMEQISFHQSYDAVEHFALDMADYSTIPQIDESDGEEAQFAPSNIDTLFSQKLSEFFAFILNLNDYDLGIIREVIAPSSGSKLNIADIARIRNISRQALHRKVLDLARQKPELRELLKCVLLKLRKNQELFKSSKTKAIIDSKKSQLELDFNL